MVVLPVWFFYGSVGIAAATNPSAMSAATVAAAVYVLGGWKGIKKSTFGYNAAEDFLADFNNFMKSKETSGQRSFFLVSQSAQLDKTTIERAVGLKNPLYPDWDPVTKQVAVMNERTVINRITSLPFRALGVKDGWKSIWVHSDLLVEKEPNGEPQVHMLVQFTAEKPDFPKKPKQKEEKKVDYGLAPLPSNLRP